MSHSFPSIVSCHRSKSRQLSPTILSTLPGPTPTSVLIMILCRSSEIASHFAGDCYELHENVANINEWNVAEKKRKETNEDVSASSSYVDHRSRLTHSFTLSATVSRIALSQCRHGQMDLEFVR